MPKDYGFIIESSPQRVVRCVAVNGRVVLQQFTAPVEIALDLAGAEDVLGMAESAAEAAQDASDPYLTQLLQSQCQISEGAPMVQRGGLYHINGGASASEEGETHHE